MTKDTIDIFLERWRASAYNYWIRAYNNYIQEKKRREAEFEELYSGKILSKERRQELRKLASKYFQWKYNQHSMIKDMDGRSEVNRIERLNINLDREVKRKKENLIVRVEKKAGKIVDTSNLYIGNNGEINGYIIGKKANVDVETISAGGYNIQVLHYRVLIKLRR